MIHKFFSKLNKDHRGTTLVELIVCFALMGIFMSAAAVVISNITNIYYDVKGETYARQVSDIILKRIAGEIEGANISLDNPDSYPVIYRSAKDVSNDNRSGEKIELYDRTNTLVQIYGEDGLLKIRYLPINPDMDPSDPDYATKHFDETIWTYDEKMYLGFTVKEIRFVPAQQNDVDSMRQNEQGQYYQATFDEMAGNEVSHEYPVNVIGVYLTLHSPKYGDFYTYRYMRMYNIDTKQAEKVGIAWKTGETPDLLTLE